MRGGNNRAASARRTSSSRRRRDRFTAERARDPWGYKRDVAAEPQPEDLDDDDARAAR